MYYVKNERNGREVRDAATNLAIEYYLLNEVELDEPLLLFYINRPSIIVGLNQNTYEEINTTYVEEQGIQVVRRFSGGGAVYHDEGVLNFCFLQANDGQSFRDFKTFTRPIIDALHKMGATEAELHGRNDLTIRDKKFSGNAMYSKNGRLTAHGTLMFDSNIDAVTAALRPKKHKLTSKGIQSIRSRVTNIWPYLDQNYQQLTTAEFRDQLLLELYQVKELTDVKEYRLTIDDWQKIDEFAKKYTANWDWNYGKSPKFDLERTTRTAAGSVEVKLNVENGKVKDIKVYGDFFGLGDIRDVERALLGVTYDAESVREALALLDLEHYIGPVTVAEMVDLIY